MSYNRSLVVGLELAKPTLSADLASTGDPFPSAPAQRESFYTGGKGAPNLGSTLIVFDSDDNS